MTASWWTPGVLVVVVAACSGPSDGTVETDGGTSTGGAAGTSSGGASGSTATGGAGGSTSSGGAAGSTGTGGAAGSISSGGSSGSTATGGAAGSTASGGAAGTGGSAGAASGGSAGAPSCGGNDPCPHPNGVQWLCEQRFFYGINYAWHHFAGDFGGISPWGQQGVSGNTAVADDLEEMSQNGVSVVRWWVWPDFRGDGVTFDSGGTPTGLGGTALADLARALELAEQFDLHVMFTLFSFDNFRPTQDVAGISVPGIRPIVVDTTERAALMDLVVRPFIRAGAASPHADRIIAWEVINEPEWAITGPGLYGSDQDFDPNPDLDAVNHAQMETFIDDVVRVIREESDALTSVGGAAMKWKSAWSNVDLDFHQFHIYDWVDQYWPYDTAPAQFGIDDKPVVMGEFPRSGLSSASYSVLTESWFTNGYAGALSWQYNESRGQLASVKAFADDHPCETRY